MVHGTEIVARYPTFVPCGSLSTQHTVYYTKKSIARIAFRSARLVLLAAIACIVQGNSVDAQTVPENRKWTIEDPRPVAAAITELVSRYRFVITYEDPRYAYEGDLKDLTTEVRRDLDKFPPGKAPKVIVPRGGSLTVHLPAAAAVNARTIASVLDQLLLAQSNRDEGGRFRVVRVGDVFHVVPSEVKDRKGIWIAQSSILDTPISLPMEDRSDAEMVGAIVKAVSAEAHVRIYVGSGVGGGISNPNRPRPYRLGAENERARDVLMRALLILNDPEAGTWITQRLRWQLFYDRDGNAYYLNIEGVPDRPSVRVAPAAGPASTDVSTSIGGTSVSPRN